MNLPFEQPLRETLRNLSKDLRKNLSKILFKAQTLLCVIFVPHIIFALAKTPTAQASSTSSSLTPNLSGGKFSSIAKAGIPTVLLLLDENTRDVFVMPPDSSKISAQNDFFQIHPATVLRTGVAPEKANATDTPLTERLTHFASVAQKKLGTLHLDAAWGSSVVQFVSASGNLTASFEKTETPWPPAVNFSASTLSHQNGQILVFTVRDASKMGILEKIDLIRLDGSGKIIRTFWSRSLNDPTITESALNAIDKATTQFQKSLRTENISFDEKNMRMVFDKRIGERDVLTTETALKDQLKNAPDAILIPFDVSETEVRYQTPVPLSKLQTFLERLKELDTRLSGVRTGETSDIQIRVQGLQYSQKNQNNQQKQRK